MEPKLFWDIAKQVDGEWVVDTSRLPEAGYWEVRYPKPSMDTLDSLLKMHAFICNKNRCSMCSDYEFKRHGYVPFEPSALRQQMLLAASP